MTETRSHEHEITIDAPIETVWKSLTDAAEIVRWFVQKAKIDARVGGRYEVSWGPGMDGVALIEAYDEPKYLKLALQPEEPTPESEASGCSMPEMKEPIIEEYWLTTDGKTTTLRLVNSRIPSTAEWDQFYDGTDTGWDGYFVTLKHVIENHPGKDRGSVEIMAPLSISTDEAFAKLVGEAGFRMSDAVAGESFETTTAIGDTFSGTVSGVIPGRMLQLHVASLDDSLFGMHLSATGPDSAFFYLALTTWGVEAEKLDDLRARWTPWIHELLGVQQAPVA